MRKRFEGCLVGALIGDCLGAPFEFSKKQRLDQILKVIAPSAIGKKNKTQQFKYTDDTAMTKSVAESLLHEKGFNAQDMATRFAKEYEASPGRGYGGVQAIFATWLSEGVEKDVFKAAREQYAGAGSYGNGAAMRVAPVALFGNNDSEVSQLAKQQSLLTHSAKHGYNGAILQAVAIFKALKSCKPLDVNVYVDNLISFMESVEGKTAKEVLTEREASDESEKDVKWSRSERFSFIQQLIVIKELLREGCMDSDRVVERLGHDITAQEAVPAAIYCFLSNAKENFEKTISFAISLGGDTDTVASMAGALAGAYFGITQIPRNWLESCEYVEETVQVAGQLYEVHS